MVSPRAGQPAAAGDLVDVAKLVTAYYALHPDPADAAQRVAFGTSGHRGSALTATFNEDHIVAATQAICEYRVSEGIEGPLYLGADTHALSEPAQVSALEVLAANGVRVLLDERGGYTPTPAVSRAILAHNQGGAAARADGIVVTPSHNPPSDGGFKYNPPDGGPAGTDITSKIQDRANELLAEGLTGVRRVPYARALAAGTTGRFDFLGAYVAALPQVIDIEAISAAGIRIGADPLGGASVGLLGRDRRPVRPGPDRRQPGGGPDLPVHDPGHRRQDPDGLLFPGCDGGADRPPARVRDRDRQRHRRRPARHRHPGRRADEPQPLSVGRDRLPVPPPGRLAGSAAVGKTLVSSSMIDRVTASLERDLLEVPVGFKWFVPGLLDGSVGFGGEESAGASFLQRDGSVWTTDKDGIILALLASEILARTGRSPSEHYAGLTSRFGAPAYARIDTPASREQKAALARLSPDQVTAGDLAGEPITATLTTAPGNGAPIGGLKVVTGSGWFAARPSGTEDVYKLYAESFKGAAHLAAIQQEAQEIVAAVLD